MHFHLNPKERKALFHHDYTPGEGPNKKKAKGGFQYLLRRLQLGIDGTNTLEINQKDLDRIPHYAFFEGGGGWETQLKAIFARTLGPSLKV